MSAMRACIASAVALGCSVPAEMEGSYVCKAHSPGFESVAEVRIDAASADARAIYTLDGLAGLEFTDVDGRRRALAASTPGGWLCHRESE